MLPLDTHIEHPLQRMQVADDPTETTETSEAVLAIAREAAGAQIDYQVVPRFRFYENAARAFAVVQTLDARPYSDIIFTKGVVAG